MFYTTEERDHGLPHDPFKAIVAPRPIGWISTLSKDGIVNLAPYSFFNAIASRPDMVMFSSVGWKHSATNARDTGEFVCNHVSAELADKMNKSCVDAPANVNEFEYAGIRQERCNLVKPPRVADANSALECKVTDILEPKDLNGKATHAVVVIGQVVGIHINDQVIRNGRFDVELAHPVTRLGYMDYDGPDGLFEMFRPEWKDG